MKLSLDARYLSIADTNVQLFSGRTSGLIEDARRQ